MSKSLFQRWFGKSTAAADQANPALIALMETAQTSLAAGDHDHAVAAYRKAATLAPAYAQARLGLGNALYQAGHHQAAREELELALTFDQGGDLAQPSAHRLLAAIQRAAGRNGEAENHYRLAMQFAPEDESNILDLCTLLVEQRRLDDAVKVVSQALSRLSHSANLLFYMGNLQQELGNTGAALDAWRSSLEQNPEQIMVLHNMGMSLLAHRELDEANEMFRRITSMTPEWAEGWYNLGLVELQNSNPDAATAHFERALALEPEFATAHCRLGETLLAKGDTASALKEFDKALFIAPDTLLAHLHRATILLSRGQHGEAEQALHAALDIAPDNPDVLLRLARVQMSKGEYEDAFLSFRRLTQQAPDNIDAMFGVGEALLAQAMHESQTERPARLDEAQAAFKAVLAIDPACIQADMNLGVIHIEKEDFDAAAAVYEKILSQDAQSAIVHHNMGAIEEARAKRAPPDQRFAMYEKAVMQYRAAFALDKNRVEPLLNIANIYQEQSRHDEARSLYHQALAIAPGNAHARMNLGLMQLARGDFANGWRNNEARWGALPGLKRLDTPVPHWDESADLNGRTILLYTEQGLGDNIQFIRFADLLARQGACVWVQAPAPLKRLFLSCPGVQKVFGEGEMIPPSDYVYPLLSLPVPLGINVTNIPSAIPYLQAEAARVDYWKDKLGPGIALRVGLVWAGNPARESRGAAEMDRMRSLHFDQIRPLLEVQGVEFHSLQVGKATAAQRDPASRVIDHAEYLTDFEETAALMTNLDLAICVDTSTAHLVGAIGKPVWLLNRLNTCWRWMADREDSPWYPTMRIFRQPTLGLWEPVIDEVRIALQEQARLHCVKRAPAD